MPGSPEANGRGEDAPLAIQRQPGAATLAPRARVRVFLASEPANLHCPSPSNLPVRRQAVQVISNTHFRLDNKVSTCYPSVCTLNLTPPLPPLSLRPA